MKVLFICHGNRYRSPFAAGLVAQLGRIKKIEVRSAGVKDPIGNYPAAKVARVAAEVRGFDLEAHRARRVTEADIKWANRVYYMDTGNLRRLSSEFGLLPKFAPIGAHIGLPVIKDPAFMKGEEQEELWETLEKACRYFVEYG